MDEEEVTRSIASIAKEFEGKTAGSSEESIKHKKKKKAEGTCSLPSLLLP